jgi:hypothetical protein
MGYIGGGYIGSVYVRGGTVAALQARGLIECDEEEYGPEKTVRVGFGVGATEQTIRPLKRQFYRLTEQGRALVQQHSELPEDSK